MIRTIVVVLVVAVAAIFGWQRATADNSAQPSGQRPHEEAEVERVIDGDTVDLLIGGQVERVRLIGVDTPESVSRSTPDQCFGAEASEALRGLLPPGTTVRVARDIEPRDRYGRLLLYLYRSDDELFVNQWLVENGFADAVSYEPNTAFAVEFAALANKARSEPVGLWATCDGPDQPLS